ncbi:MAG: acyl-CoA thioesterase, partial [Acidimicrobiia bacterium]|nr:acyl-CoA thioesterase [Acidimicrobiia bacterium]MDX2468123.1 acyl-CoA thioesterase [Acidimicrobiia bacterium]
AIRMCPRNFMLSNNGRYLTHMDLGRVDLIVRMGVVSTLRKRRWAPVIASTWVRFHRSLRLFQRYELRSRVVSWDERWIYLEQNYWQHGRLIASSVAQLRFLTQGGNGAPR